MNENKLGIVRNPAAAKAWRAAQPQRCWVCNVPEYAVFLGLQVHHMAGAAGRSDEPCNFFLVCQQHHDECGDGTISLEQQLELKRLRDPTHHLPARVYQLKGFAQPLLDGLDQK